MLMMPEDFDRWLHGSTVGDAMAMQKPVPNDAIVMRPPEKKAA
jgi:hypothetical protein